MTCVGSLYRGALGPTFAACIGTFTANCIYTLGINANLLWPLNYTCVWPVTLETKREAYYCFYRESRRRSTGGYYPHRFNPYRAGKGGRRCNNAGGCGDPNPFRSRPTPWRRRAAGRQNEEGSVNSRRPRRAAQFKRTLH